MRSAYASIAALMVSVFGVLAGTGVLTTLLPIRAQIEGFPARDIGFMGSAYFAGMLAGAILTPWLVQRLGHIKAFGASSALGACRAGRRFGVLAASSCGVRHVR